MCNIAGYVGTEPAAPILIEMMRRQEGLNAGYYTGIATLHEGKIYYAKLTGDMEHLLEKTDAAHFPGNIGIIHSRTKSGGGDEWAHPFVGKNAAGEVMTAYVANGSAGCFSGRTPEYNALAEQLIAAGYPMNARLRLEEDRYQKLSDGTSVHMSDIMCQLILRNMDQGMAGAAAMESAFCEMPGEIVGLMLSLKETDRISWARINAPMQVGFSSHGAYLASAALGFLEDAGEPVILPACFSGSVYRNRVEINPFAEAPVKVAVLDACVRAEAYRVICEELKAGPKTFPELAKMIKPLFGEAESYPNYLAGYEVIYSLQKQGVLQISQKRVPGVFEGLKAPLFELSL